MERKKILKTINLISGSGTTSLEVLKAQREGEVLHDLVETVAIVSSDPQAQGIQRAIDFGFPEEHIYVVKPEDNLSEQLLNIFDKYEPDYFHQLGWMPFTPSEVIAKYKGLNQHLGPGGKWMYGVRRIYAHQRFCQMINEKRPIPVFIQLVGSEYDSGEIVYIRWEDLLDTESPEAALKRLFEIEYQVQIEGLRRLATGEYTLEPPPKIAKNQAEEDLLFEARKEARDKYSRQPNTNLFHPS